MSPKLSPEHPIFKEMHISSKFRQTMVHNGLPTNEIIRLRRQTSLATVTLQGQCVGGMWGLIVLVPDHSHVFIFQ